MKKENSIDEYREEIKARRRVEGMTRQQAVANIAKIDPGLHKAYLMEYDRHFYANRLNALRRAAIECVDFARQIVIIALAIKDQDQKVVVWDRSLFNSFQQTIDNFLAILSSLENLILEANETGQTHHRIALLAFIELQSHMLNAMRSSSPIGYTIEYIANHRWLGNLDGLLMEITKERSVALKYLHERLPAEGSIKDNSNKTPNTAHWSDVTMKVSLEDDMIEYSIKNGPVKACNYQQMNLSSDQFKCLQGLAMRNGDGTAGATMTEDMRQRYKRLSEKLEKAIAGVDGKAIVRGKTAFLIQLRSTNREREIERLSKEQQYDDNETVR